MPDKIEKPGDDELEKMYNHQDAEIKSRSEWGVIIHDKFHYGALAVFIIGLFISVCAFYVDTNMYGQAIGEPGEYLWQLLIGVPMMIIGILAYIFTKS